MRPRAALLQLGKLVGNDLARGRVSDDARSAGEALAASPESLLAILDLVTAEAGRDRPDERLVTGFLFLIGVALNVLRMMDESRHPTATGVVEELRSRLVAAARSGDLDPGLLLLIGRQFASAKLDIGDELRGLMAELAGGEAHADPEATPEQLQAHYRGLAASLDQDPFAIHAELAETAHTFPEEQRIGLIASLVYSQVSAVRDASLGWLLDRSVTVSREAGALIADAARQGLVSPQSWNRMILMRNWLPENRREQLDPAIRACQERGTPAAPAHTPDIRNILLSGSDGAGAQSAFFVVKEGRSFALASILLKHGHGVRDAWVRHGVRRAEADAMLGYIDEEVEHFGASLEAIETCLANALAMNVETRTPPPFGLVDFVEAVGLQSTRPLRKTGDALIDQLVDEIPAGRKRSADVARALAASAHWPMIYGAMQSWFEEGESVHGVLASVRPKKKRRDAVLDRILPDRRTRWAELVAWTALAVREEDRIAGTGLALVARELRSERPLRDIPIAVWIARNTVDAFEQGSQGAAVLSL